MANRLSDRLRRLGVKKGARHLRPAPPIDPNTINNEKKSPRSATAADVAQHQLAADGPAQQIHDLYPQGTEIQSPVGHCFVVEYRYPLTTLHGRWRLGDMLAFSNHLLPHIFGDPDLGQSELENTLFVDTETTGLYGAGVFPFLVGVGYFSGSEFVVKQIFARDHGEEAAVLDYTLKIIARKKHLVTFNGHAFDLPLLDQRFRLNRFEPPHGELMGRPGMDLFRVGRRIWHWAVPSCSLIGLEQSVMAIQRHEPDIPGSLIPWVYRQYIQAQDARPLQPVFSHNRMDLLSMVTLLSELLVRFEKPNKKYKPLEHYGLARFWLKEGKVEPAEQQLRLAAEILPADGVYNHEEGLILRELAILLKRQKRRDEARQYWERLAHHGRNIEAHVELAKWCEWEIKAYDEALKWTEEALKLQANPIVQQELEHRQARLKQKMK
ncbi:MAG: ribonuclease H-like domain-containing protein [Ardenticatenaceae bacterium]|nr:ribonuclease H-like domain-containing protein [Ardenticatenaceae bacterium]